MYHVWNLRQEQQHDNLLTDWTISNWPIAKIHRDLKKNKIDRTDKNDQNSTLSNKTNKSNYKS